MERVQFFWAQLEPGPAWTLKVYLKLASSPIFLLIKRACDNFGLKPCGTEIWPLSPSPGSFHLYRDAAEALGEVKKLSDVKKICDDSVFLLEDLHPLRNKIYGVRSLNLPRMWKHTLSLSLALLRAYKPKACKKYSPAMKGSLDCISYFHSKSYRLCTFNQSCSLAKRTSLFPFLTVTQVTFSAAVFCVFIFLSLSDFPFDPSLCSF